MITLVVRADAAGAFERAVALLRAHGLVAFPTETVYGLGADATSELAVAQIFRAKGRPATNPIIVHVSDASMAMWCTRGFDARARALADRFWPGPLTLVLGRAAKIPAIVAAGGDSVAIRAPAHAVAQRLLEKLGGPIAAPSANRSSSISPTRAEHVRAELDGRIPLILDGGPSEIGLESTVLDLVRATPRVLRPGAITRSALEAALGQPVQYAEPVSSASAEAGKPLRSPGMMARHYAPTRPLYGFSRDMVPDVLRDPSVQCSVLFRGEAEEALGTARRCLPEDPDGFGRELYDALRWADVAPASAIWVELPPAEESWHAIRDRLRRAMVRDSG